MRGRPSGAHVWIGLVLTALLLTSCGMPFGARGPSPHLEVSPRALDLGIIIPGDRAARILTFRNTGREPLVVRWIRPSSQRLTTGVPTLTLTPGGTRDLPFEFRAEQWEEGPFREFLLIYSNDPEQPLVKVRVQGGLQSPIAWTPKVPFVGFTSRDMAKPIRLVGIRSRDRTPIGPLRATSLVPYTEAKVTAVGPEQYVVDLILDRYAPLVPLLGWVRIDTVHPKMPVIVLPVRGQVMGNLRPQPYQFDFHIVEEGEIAVATITLINGGPRPVRILKVEPHLPAAPVISVKPLGKQHVISLKIPSAPPRWSLEGVVNIFTDDPREPVVQVPVTGWVAVKKPFDRLAGGGSDAGLYGLLKAALFEDENKLPSDEIVSTVFGGVQDDRVVSLLLRALREDHFLYRQRAAEVLGLLKSQRALEPIRALITDDWQEDVRMAAAEALVQIAGRDALPTILLALQDNHDWVRDDAAGLLGQLGDRQAIPALKAALKDESKDVRDTAARSLKTLEGGSPATPALPTAPP